MRSTEQSGFLVERDAHRHPFKNCTQTPLVEKGAHEAVPLQKRQNFWRYPAADIQTAEREEFKRQIRRLRSINVGKKLQRMDAARVLSGKRHFADNRRCITSGDALLQPF